MIAEDYVEVFVGGHSVSNRCDIRGYKVKDGGAEFGNATVKQEQCHPQRNKL